MKIVKFEDGTYGVRKLGFLEWLFFDGGSWNTMERSLNHYVRVDLESAKKLFIAAKLHDGINNDSGKVI